MNPSLTSSNRMDWGTPRDFFDRLHGNLRFNVDVCASQDNALLPLFWTKDDDGLNKSWRGMRCWMNPPYGREIGAWMDKARNEVQYGGAYLAACLVPSRTDTQWWSRNVPHATEVRFIVGRLRFEGASHPAPFPSALVIFDPNKRYETQYSYIKANTR